MVDFCHKIYIDDNQVMKTTIERWKNVNDALITYSLPHQHNNVTIPNNLLCQYYLQSFIQLNQFAIYNLIIKCDLNSKIVSNRLYIYNVSEQFSGKQSSQIKDISTIEFNISNGTIEDFLVIKSNNKLDERFQMMKCFFWQLKVILH